MKKKAKRTTAVQSISINPQVLNRAKKAAKQGGRTLSGYVQWLLEKDLQRESVAA